MPENQDVLPKWDSRQIHNIDCEEIALKTYLELIVKWLDIFGNLESKIKENITFISLLSPRDMSLTALSVRRGTLTADTSFIPPDE